MAKGARETSAPVEIPGVARRFARPLASYVSSVLTAGDTLLSAAGAVAAVYLFGYLAGSLLVEGGDEDFGLAWAVIFENGVYAVYQFP